MYDSDCNDFLLDFRCPSNPNSKHVVAKNLNKMENYIYKQPKWAIAVVLPS